MNSDEFEYVEEHHKPKKSKFLLLIIIIVVLVAGAVFAIFKFTDIELPWKKEDSKLKEYIQELDSQHKGYSKESDLIIPEFQSKQISKVRDFNIVLSDLDADQTGYIFDMTITNESSDYVNFDCSLILIDGFETSESFSIDLVPYEEQKIKINIKKTELLQLEIRDFNKLTFVGKITTSEGRKRNFKFDVPTLQLDPVKNEKVGLIKVDEIENLLISFYKKVEDNTNYYLYFDLKNVDNYQDYELYIDKLSLAGKYYEDDIQIVSRNGSEKIFYLSIPKDSISSFDNFEISFFVVKNYENGNKEIFVTNNKKLYL